MSGDWLVVSGVDARRLKACVDAVAGIPTEALEAGALGKALDLAGITSRCLSDMDVDGIDELKAALRALGRLP